jgi:hypothetical protein
MRNELRGSSANGDQELDHSDSTYCTPGLQVRDRHRSSHLVYPTSDLPFFACLALLHTYLGLGLPHDMGIEQYTRGMSKEFP